MTLEFFQCPLLFILSVFFNENLLLQIRGINRGKKRRFPGLANPLSLESSLVFSLVPFLYG
jgi:hypothetical protein